MRIYISPEQQQQAAIPTLEEVAFFTWGVAYAGRMQLQGEACWVVVLQDIASASPENIWFSYTGYDEYAADVAYLRQRGSGGAEQSDALVPAGPRTPRRSGADAKPLPDESE